MVEESWKKRSKEDGGLYSGTVRCPDKDQADTPLDTLEGIFPEESVINESEELGNHTEQEEPDHYSWTDMHRLMRAKIPKA